MIRSAFIGKAPDHGPKFALHDLADTKGFWVEVDLDHHVLVADLVERRDLPGAVCDRETLDPVRVLGGIACGTPTMSANDGASSL